MGVLVTIVLPTRNRAGLLPEAIESVRAQTFGDWELIVVDDASDDETTAVVEGFARLDGRVRLLRNPKNLHIAASLNAGFQRAEGDLWTWTSDDNRLRPPMLERLVPECQRADLAYSAMALIDGEGHVTGGKAALPPRLLLLENVVGASFLYRAAAARRIGGYDPSWRLVEDWDHWIRLASQGRLVAVPEDLYEYRLHEGSLTETRRGEILAKVEALLLHHLPTLRRPHSAAARLHLASYAWQRGARGASRRLGLASLLHGGLGFRGALADSLLGSGWSRRRRGG